MAYGTHLPWPLDVLSADEDEDEDVDCGEEGHGHQPCGDQPGQVDVVVDVPRVQTQTGWLNIQLNISFEEQIKFVLVRNICPFLQMVTSSH